MAKILLRSLYQKIFGDVNNVRINQDGSKAFFNNYHLIYKVEGSTATQILDTDDYNEVDRCWGIIQITADGEWVYFREYADDLWRIGQGGGPPERIIDDAAVQFEEDPGYQIYDFDISANGSTIVFGINGYRDNGLVRWKFELFSFNGGNFVQLTNDTINVLKSNPTISGDGSTIVFCHWGENKWYSIKPDGSSKITLEDRGINIGGADLTYDGTKMFYFDFLANGGRLVNTDGSGSFDLFPWRIGPVPSNNLYISNDGSQISFTTSYGIPTKDALYKGYLNEPVIVSDAPVIHNIEFDPSSMPDDDPEASLILTTQISDPQGLTDITNCTVDELLDGHLVEKNKANLPTYFAFDPHDDGNWPDQTVDDGLFSTEGKPGDRITEFDSMIVRIGTIDVSNKVVVADALLYIGLTGIRNKKFDYLPHEFILYQNYPNPFNPSTTIVFDLPKTSDVTLKIFNILGGEVVTLVSDRLPAGSYTYQWSRPVGMASSVYLYRLFIGSHSREVGECVKTRKMLLLR